MMTLTSVAGSECSNSATGADYGGTLAVSSNGTTCSSWNSLASFLDSDFPNDASMAAASNYCRYIARVSYFGFWCDVDGSPFQCDLPRCSCMYKILNIGP